MAGRVEKTYSKIIKYIYHFANPFKKAIIKTQCDIHKSINFQALEIIKNDKFLDAYCFFSDYITQLNEGVVWADQDFKSSGHFYNPVKKKGLYGNTDALSLATGYYSKALSNWKTGDIDKSMFYLGATAHIIQDMTIPQHANIRLLDSHRQYENFIKRTFANTPKYLAFKGGYYMNSIEEFVRCNARNAIRIYRKLKSIEDSSRRFYTITKFTLPLAQKTTAGCLIRFYRDISSMKHNQRMAGEHPIGYS